VLAVLEEGIPPETSRLLKSVLLNDAVVVVLKLFVNNRDNVYMLKMSKMLLY
jgi:hypothetical protein